ncbi:MAG: class I SAM-dependent methyltransferase [Chthoniobacterales bacterium]
MSIFEKFAGRSKRRFAEADCLAPTAEQQAAFAREEQMYGLGDDRALDGLGLMKALMLYRPRPIGKYLASIGRRYSMLHPDVLALLYYLARHARGDILEIGPYVGGSTIAAAQGVRDARHPKKIVTIEHGMMVGNSRLGSGDTIEDLKRNLAREGVANLVQIIVGEARAKSTVESVGYHLGPQSVGVFVMDADGAIKDALQSYSELLIDNCWVVVDDYFAVGAGINKAMHSKLEIDSLVDSAVLTTAGFFGWGTWIGQWRRNAK